MARMTRASSDPGFPSFEPAEMNLPHFRGNSRNSRMPLYFPQQCLYFLPLLQGQASLRPTLGPARTGLAFSIAAAASLTMSLAWPARRPAWASGLVLVVVPPKALAD